MALKRKKQGKPIPEEFKGFQTAVVNLVGNTIEAKSSLLKQRLQTILEDIKMVTKETVSFKEEQFLKANDLLQHLNGKPLTETGRFESAVEEVCQRLSMLLDRHIQDVKIRQEMSSCGHEELSKNGDDIDDVKRKACQIVTNKVTQELAETLRKHGGDERTQDLQDEMKRKFEFFIGVERRQENTEHKDKEKCTNTMQAPCDYDAEALSVYGLL